MKRKTNKSEDEPTRIDIINSFILGAEKIINIIQNSINDPTFKNFCNSQSLYEEWIWALFKFIDNFDEKRAKKIIGNPDGVRTSLDVLEQRRNNISPGPITFSKNKNDNIIYADESGLRMLQNMIFSLKEKNSNLKQYKLEITGGVLSKEDAKKISIRFYSSGKIMTNINKKEIQKKKNSVILKIINKIRERNGIKLRILSSEINVTESNTSREITSFNEEIKKTWPLITKKIIEKGNGYYMNKDIFNFFYDDVNT